MQILAFLARRGKIGEDRLTGKNRDAGKGEFEVILLATT
jgi:hypothetical protein